MHYIQNDYFHTRSKIPVHCWMLHVTSVCTPCYMLLGVVAQSLKLVKLLSHQLPTFRSPKRLAQQCWIRLHSSSMLGLRTRITHSLQSLMGCIRQVPTLLGVVAPVCTPLPTWTQKLPKLKTGFS